MELCSMLYGSLDGRGVWGRTDTCICIADSLHHSHELSQHCLLVSYTPIQNKKFKKKKRKKISVKFKTKEIHSTVLGQPKSITDISVNVTSMKRHARVRSSH